MEHSSYGQIVKELEKVLEGTGYILHHFEIGMNGEVTIRAYSHKVKDFTLSCLQEFYPEELR
jgi:hypothetical protein